MSEPETHTTQNTDIEIYVEHMAAMLGLPIPDDQMAGVVENVHQLKRVSEAVLEFPLPDTLEPLPRFEP